MRTAKEWAHKALHAKPEELEAINDRPIDPKDPLGSTMEILFEHFMQMALDEERAEAWRQVQARFDIHVAELVACSHIFELRFPEGSGGNTRGEITMAEWARMAAAVKGLCRGLRKETV